MSHVCESSIKWIAVMLAMLAFGAVTQAGPPYPKVNLAVGYQVDPDWPQKPAEYKWRYAVSVFVDEQDRVWTLNTLNPPVQVYSTDGALLDAWGEGEFSYPHHLHIDRQGNVWIADFRMHVVKKFTPKGQHLLTLGTPNEPGADDRHFNGPTATATTVAGDVFISDGYGNDRIVHFDAQGRFVKAWGRLGQGRGELSQPHAIAIDSHGRIYVAERNNCRVQVFDQSGRSLAEWRNLINPWGIWITPKDEILVCGSSPGRWDERGNLANPPHDALVIKFNPEGRALELWHFPLVKDGRPEPGAIDWVHGIAADSKGNLYLSDVADDSPAHRVQKFIRLPPDVPPARASNQPSLDRGGRIEFVSSRFHYTFGPHEPTLRIKPGTSLRIICPDSDNELADGTLLKPEQRQREPDTTLFEGNPVAGPIYVEGAEPGDCIAVHIEHIELDRAKGQTLLAPAHGLLPIGLLAPPHEDGTHDAVPRHMYLWNIDPAAGIATLTNPLGPDRITVRLDPFVGAIGVAPQWGQSISTLLNGEFGGNMDLPAVRPGTTVYLPVFREGGLVMMGDLHGAQGQGEIIGGAIETCGKVDCTIDLIKDRTLPGPRLKDGRQLMAVGTGVNLRDAITRAYAHLLDWLVEGYGLNRWDAYNLMSQTGTVSLTNCGFPPTSAAAGIPIAALPEHRRHER